MPGPFGIGDLGPEAYAFADFLRGRRPEFVAGLAPGPTATAIRLTPAIQHLPATPFSVSPEQLIADSLREGDVGDLLSLHLNKSILPQSRNLRSRSCSGRLPVSNACLSFTSCFRGFLRAGAYWLDDYSLFRALKDAHGGGAWNEWDPALVSETPGPWQLRRENSENKSRRKSFISFFFRQWFALKAIAIGVASS